MNMELATGLDLPLREVTVLVTRPRVDAESLVAALEERGARVVAIPAIRVAPPTDFQSLDQALHMLAGYDWVAFTSRNAVRATLNRMQELRVAIPSSTRIASLGAGTSDELIARHLSITVKPEQAAALGLAQAMIALGAGGTRVLQPAGDRARPELRDALRHAGATVDVVQAYRTIQAEDGAASLVGIDMIALASPTAFYALLDRFGVETLRGVELACIGPTTAESVRTAGLQPSVVAQEQSNLGLATAIASHYEGRNE